MQQFRFCSPRSLNEALNCLSDKKDRCKIIAGGTDLIPALRLEDIRPEVVLNILEIEELAAIREDEDSIRIGSTVTFTEIVESDPLNRHLPLLVQAAASAGGPQVRNRGTIGGNIANASPAADLLPAVIALEGQLELCSKVSGKRRVPLVEAVLSPYKTSIRPDEMLTEIVIQKLQPGTKTAFEKLGRRNAMARARMNLSLMVAQEKDGRVAEIRIVPGAVMPVARRMKRAEEVLLGKKPGDKEIEAASDALIEEMIAGAGRRWSTEYKVPVMCNIFGRILRSLIK